MNRCSGFDPRESTPGPRGSAADAAKTIAARALPVVGTTRAFAETRQADVPGDQRLAVVVEAAGLVAIAIDPAVLRADAEVTVAGAEGRALEPLGAHVRVALRRGAEEADARACDAEAVVSRVRVALETQRRDHRREAREPLAAAREPRRLL